MEHQGKEQKKELRRYASFISNNIMEANNG